LRTVAGRAGRVARDVTHGLRLLGCAAVTRGGDVETTARPGPQRSSEALRCGTGPCCGGGSPRYPQRAPGSRCGSPSIERNREARRPGGPTWQRLVGATSSGPVHRPHPIREVRRGPHTVPSWRAAVNGEPRRRGTGKPPCRRVDGAPGRFAADLPPTVRAPRVPQVPIAAPHRGRPPAGGRVPGPAHRLLRRRTASRTGWPARTRAR
jgi:hypothetical protein